MKFSQFILISAKRLIVLIMRFYWNRLPVLGLVVIYSNSWKVISKIVNNELKLTTVSQLPFHSIPPKALLLDLSYFLIFINDLPCVCVNLIMLLFADDSKISNADLIELQNDLIRIYNWAKANKMEFNNTKTELQWFTLHRYKIL